MASPSPVVLLWGDDTYALKAAEEDLIARIVDPAFASLNLNLLEGPYTAPSQAVAAAGTMPFGPGGRLVIVRDCPYFSAGKFTGDDEVEVLAEAVERGLPPGCHLVLSVPRGIDKRLSQTKAIVAKAEVREFSLGKSWDDRPAIEWLMNEARTDGVKLGNDVAQALVSALGSDRWRLRSELSKLATYAAGAPISLEMVQLLSPPGETDVFAMLQAIADRKPVAAIARLRKLLVTEAALKLLATMATMMRGWLSAKLLAERGMNADAIAQALGAKSSYKIKKDLDQCRAWSSGQLRGALALLLEADVALKTGSGRGLEALQLEKLLVQLSRL
ncbi:MAG TPA: DNA polymerase III subunit delta [Pantanalinema sp.]